MNPWEQDWSNTKVIDAPTVAPPVVSQEASRNPWEKDWSKTKVVEPAPAPQPAATPGNPWEMNWNNAKVAEPIPIDQPNAVFDPEGSGYDMQSAVKAGLKPTINPEDGLPHWPSRDPQTGLLLKGRQHDTWDKLVQGENASGYEIYKGQDNRYYSKQKTTQTTPTYQGLPGQMPGVDFGMPEDKSLESPGKKFAESASGESAYGLSRIGAALLGMGRAALSRPPKTMEDIVYTGNEPIAALTEPTEFEKQIAEETEKRKIELPKAIGKYPALATRLASKGSELASTIAATLALGGAGNKALTAPESIASALKQMAPDIAKFWATSFVTTDGTDAERAKAATHNAVMMASSALTGGIGGTVLRTATAAALNAAFNSETYAETYQNAVNEAQAKGGNPLEYFITEAGPNMLLDLFFGIHGSQSFARNKKINFKIRQQRRDAGVITSLYKPEIVKQFQQLLQDAQAKTEGTKTSPTPESQATSQPLPIEPGKVEIKTRVEEPSQGESMLDPGAYPVVDMLINDIKLSKEVPNFKADADPESGVVRGEQLSGEFNELGTAPIVVWQRINGDLEIITGRHKLDLARRTTGKETIKGQYVREADGFTAQMARIMDAEANIRDGNGKVLDYAHYFRNSGMQETEAKERGLLARPKGRTGWILGKYASDDLYALYTQNRYTRTDGKEVEGKISEDRALAIATAAPESADMQRVGIQYALTDEKPTASELNDFLQDFQRQPAAEQKAKQLDLFGTSDASINESIKMSKAVGKIRAQMERELSVLRAGKKAVKFSEVAKQYGINVADPEAIQTAITNLTVKLEDWTHWRTDPAKTRLARQTAGLPVLDESSIETGSPPTKQPLPIRETLANTIQDKTKKMSLRRKAMALTDALKEGRIDEPEAIKRWNEAISETQKPGVMDIYVLTPEEARTKIKAIEEMQSVTISAESLTKEKAYEEYVKLGNAQNEKDHKFIVFVKSIFGKLERHKGQDYIFRLIPYLRELVKTAEPIYSETERNPETHANIIAYHNYLIKVSIDQKSFFVRITAQEIKKFEETQLHNIQLSDVEIIGAGEKNNPSGLTVPFGTPTKHSPTSQDYKLADWFKKIKTLADQSSGKSENITVAAGSPPVATGGPLGKPGVSTTDPTYTRLPLGLPELVEFAMYLSKNGTAPAVKRIVKALEGTALGVFRAIKGKSDSGKIEMRMDLFKRLTEQQEQELRGQAAEYATNNNLNSHQATEYYEYIRKEALKEAEKTGPVMALKVLAHEIGHWIDFLPDATLSRGNVLGHISGVWNYTKRFLTDSPDDASLHITPKEKARRKRAAERQLKEELGTVQEIIETITREEPIYKESGLTADNIREFFGTSAREDMPEAYMWFAGLDPQTKKEIVKLAMKGILDERAARFVKKEQIGTRTVTEEKRTVTGGREPTKQEIKERFAKLMKEEIERRRLIELTAIKAELEPVVAWWRGTEKMEDYFKTPEEMYAEVFSVLMNNPVELEKRAPLFWRAWNNYVDARPEARNMYEQLQERMKTGGRLQHLRERVRESMRKVAEQGIAITDFTGELTKREKKDRRLYTFDRIFGPMYSRLIPHLRKGTPEQQRDAAKAQQSIDDFRFKAIEHERYLRKMNQDVSAQLVNAGLDWMDLGEYMLYKHIEENRKDIASTLGIDVNNARQLLAEMETNYDKEKMDVLRKTQLAWWRIRQEMVIDPLAASGLLPPELMEVMQQRDFYATISAAITGKPTDTLETLLEKRYGANTGPRILKQEGWLGEVGNPATALVAKDLSLISWLYQQSAKREIVEWLVRNDTTLNGKPMVRKADTRWTGRHNEPVEIENDRLGTIMFMQNGKLQAWYVPRTIADAFNARYSLAENTMVKLLVSANGVLKGVYTQWNYGFWPFNFLRDTRALVHNVPGTGAWNKLREIPAGIRLARQTVGLKELTPEAETYMERKMLGAHAEPMGEGSADREFERQLERYSITPATWNKEAVAPLGRLKAAWQRYLTFGTVIERAVKIAGARYLDKNYPDMPEWKKREIVHEMAGSPDFWNKAKANPTLDALQLFYNARKEGYRSAIKSFKEHPAERMYKHLKFTLLPAMLITAACHKMLSQLYKQMFGKDNEDLQDFEETYRYVSSYDLDNYEIVPLAWVDKTGTIRHIGSENLRQDKRGWKVMYARLPMDQSEQLIHGLSMKVMRAGKAPEGYDYLNALTFASGELPTGNPIWNSVLNLGLYYFAGVNPVDLRTGRPILTDDVAAARDRRAAVDLSKWTANQYASIIGRFQSERMDREAPSNVEKFLKLPGISNLAGRFVKVSDQGIYDEVARTEGKITQQDASTRLDALEGLRQERTTGKTPAWVIERMGNDPYFTQYYTQKNADLGIQRVLTPQERAVIKPKSTRTRAEVIQLEGQKR